MRMLWSLHAARNAGINRNGALIQDPQLIKMINSKKSPVEDDESRPKWDALD